MPKPGANAPPRWQVQGPSFASAPTHRPPALASAKWGGCRCRADSTPCRTRGRGGRRGVGGISSESAAASARPPLPRAPRGTARPSPISMDALPRSSSFRHSALSVRQQ